MSRPFARAMAMMALVAAAMRLQGSTARDQALANIGTYESRGKGRGLRSPSRNKAAHVQRAAVKAKNRKANRGNHG